MSAFFFIFLMTRMISSVVSTSRLLVGSSKMMTSGFIARMEAIAIFCFSPPDKEAVSLFLRYSPFTILKDQSILFFISFLGRHRFSSPKAISSSTVMVQIWDSGSCCTIPIFWASSNRSNPSIGFPWKNISPSWWPVSFKNPAILRANVDLPLPLFPVINTSSLSILRLIFFRTHSSTYLNP